MKISELQNILEHYKQENGDLEVRLVIDTHNGEEYNELISNCIDTYSFHINFNKQNYGNKQKSDAYHQ